MADYKATDTEFTTVANAIRTKGGTSAQLEWPTGFANAVAALPSGATLGTKMVTANGTYNASSDNLDGYSQVEVNVAGGGGGAFLFSRFGFFGDQSAPNISSLACQFNGEVGDKFILVVLHRPNISISDADASFIRSDKNTGYEQYISLFLVTLTSASKTITISAASTGRVCACAFKVSSLTSLTLKEQKTTASGNVVSISPAAQPQLVVSSATYTGGGSPAPSAALSWVSLPASPSSNNRLFALISAELSQNIQLSTPTDSAANSVFIYTITP